MSEIGETYKALKLHRQEQRRCRFGRIMASRAEVETWCAQYEITLTIRNGGQHWTFTHKDNRADWWPSSSKLVFNSKFNNSRGCGSARHLIGILKSRWNLRSN